MEVFQVLKSIGLTEKEASVYLALLTLGTADVGEIAQKSGQKRTTCYTVIENLKKKVEAELFQTTKNAGQKEISDFANPDFNWNV